MTVMQQIEAISADRATPVTMVLGKDDYLQTKIRQAFTALIPEEERAMNLGRYDMSETTLATALDDAMSAPFFGDHRLVMIDAPSFFTGETKNNKLDHDLDGLLAYLEHPEPSTFLVFFAPYDKLDSRKKITKTLKKVATMIDITTVNEPEIRSIIQNTVQAGGFTIEEGAVISLLTRTDANLALIMNELPKLMLYRQGQPTIDEASVALLVTTTLSQNVFDLINDVLKKDTTAAVLLYRQLILNQEEPLKINALLEGQFRLLVQIKILLMSGYSQGSLATTLKVHPYRVKLGMQTAKRFSLDDLKRAYLGLVAIEIKMKSTQIEPTLMFELFMLEFVDQVEMK